MGFHLVRNHFYEPVPDTRTFGNEFWDTNSELLGVDMNEVGQVKLLTDCIAQYALECNFPTRPTNVPHEFHLGNGFFEALDAEVLHCFVRHIKPRKVIEIGSGNSTMISARAALMNKEKDEIDTEVTCIEPNPHTIISEGFPGLTKLIPLPVQKVSLDMFQDLGENDILFIDSSHTVKLGSDVLFEYLEVLPRLNLGVIVHIHDVFLPAHYPKQWVISEHKFWTEQYLLQAFLTFNRSFEVLWASSFMSVRFKKELERLIPSWRGSYSRLPESHKDVLTRDGENVWPVSFWIRRVH